MYLILVNLIKSCVLFLFLLLTHTFFHELSHYVVANYYQKTSGVIALKFFCGKIRIKRLQIIKGYRMGYTLGETFLENEYKVYTDKQMINIAKAGTIGDLLYGFITFIICICINFSLLKISMFFVALLLYLITILTNFFLAKGEKRDIDIIRNPKIYCHVNS